MSGPLWRLTLPYSEFGRSTSLTTQISDPSAPSRGQPRLERQDRLPGANDSRLTLHRRTARPSRLARCENRHPTGVSWSPSGPQQPLQAIASNAAKFPVGGDCPRTADFLAKRAFFDVDAFR